jgi:hypothetical protein
MTCDGCKGKKKSVFFSNKTYEVIGDKKERLCAMCIIDSVYK